MSGQREPSELERALARPDIDDLRRVATVYHDWSERPIERECDWHPELDVWFDWSDTDRDLALVILLASTYDDAEFLGLVAAGKLEDILSHRPSVDGIDLSESVLQRVIDEARRTPRFRWMLGSVWTSGIPRDKAARIAEVVDGMSNDTSLLPPWPSS